MNIMFYNVKKRKSVSIPIEEVTKVRYSRITTAGKEQVRYAFRAKDEGTQLTLFASKVDWDAIDAEIVDDERD